MIEDTLKNLLNDKILKEGDHIKFNDCPTCVIDGIDYENKRFNVFYNEKDSFPYIYVFDDPELENGEILTKILY